MLLFAAFVLIAPSLRAQANMPRVELRRGLVITSSVRIIPRVYNIAANVSTDSAVIVIRGDNITVDFDGAELRGAALSSEPDEARGVAVRIEGGRNIRVLNARIRGYRVGIMAIGTYGLQLASNNVSFNWKPRLFSLVEHESLVDWMSFHKNENREWLRFGAGIYLEGVKVGDIRQNIVEQGSNGLLMVRSDSLRIHDNSFSYNSALGIGLYRSSYNSIYGNFVDYNVRGYSHGFFRRGQDSAALLMYEQSSHNVVAWNSMTHSGDGLFLWAGQSTMDSGRGGANDNLFFNNDFSFAPTNGIEATFSRNDFIANRVEGSDHGLWGGYSYNSRIVGNCFEKNRIGIAIEHGQEILIAQNTFHQDSLGIRLWANAIEPSDWGYPKQRDTQSRDYRMQGNVFRMTGKPTSIENTTFADSSANRYESAGASRTGAARCDASSNVPVDIMGSIRSRLPSQRTTPSTAQSVLKRDAIIVDEWGPFDWRSPKLWPLDSTRAATVRLRVLGPAGRWKLVSRRGLKSVSKTSGAVGDTIVVSANVDAAGKVIPNWNVSLEYTGAATISPRGVPRSANLPTTFSYEVFEPKTNWTVKFFVWNDTNDPRTKADEFKALINGTSSLTRTESRLDYMWSRPTIKELPPSKFAAVATSRITVPAGTYSLRTISDDAIRVWIDGRLVIDYWQPHESAVNYAPIAPGVHNVRVEYAQVEGWTELRVDVVKGSPRGTGTLGPH